MKVAVTGAFSYSGKYVARRLLERGEQVITLTGHPNRPDPFNGQVKAFPLDFGDVDGLTRSLRGVDTLYNTYWVRFDRGPVSHQKGVVNTRTLIRAAVSAGVRRIVHVSITNPSAESPLPYFAGKALNEQAVIESGLSYAILRPTVLFGVEDILINNIAWLLRRFPLFALPGDGVYALQPIYVEDLAELMVYFGYTQENILTDAVGPDILGFGEMVRLIGKAIGRERPLLKVPPKMALMASQVVSAFVGDVVLTQDEVDGLMAGLLVSRDPPRGKTRLADWLAKHKDSVGMHYASEIARHYK